MKKITAFFLAFMPIFVVVLLFISGMIVKSTIHVYVRQVEISEKDLEIQKAEDSKQETYKLSANVLPLNSSNPDVTWASSDESIATVDNKGLVTTVGWGDCYIYVASKENPMLMDRCKLEVWDNKIHKIVIDNEFNAQYLPHYQSVKLETRTVPNTRLTVDPTLEFSSDSSDIDQEMLKQTGTIRSTTGNNADVKVTIKTKEQEGQPSVSKDLDVKIRAGVVQVAPKDASNEVTSKQKINFADEIISFPDKDVIASDYYYTSSDETIAKVSNDEKTAGEVTFLQKNKDVKITASYKRNENLVVQKTLKSSCQYLDKVYFNRYNFSANLSETKGKNLDISYSTYPVDEENVNIWITSSDRSVIEPQRNQNNKWEFKVMGPGTALLKALITLDQEGHTSEDYCLVTINNDNPEESFFKQQSVVTKSYYYSLRDNINTEVLFPRHQELEWTIDNENIASIDKDNWIVHFNQEGTTTVTAKTKDGNEYSFALQCSPSEAKELSTEQTEFKITVGTKYNFGDCYLRDLSEESFDVETTGLLGRNIVSFIPKNGGVYTAKLHGASLFAKTITLKVEEKPVDITYGDKAEAYIATVSNTFKPKEVLEPKIIPTTAADAEGALLPVKYNYATEQQIVKVEDDVITFLQSSTALIYVSAGDLEPDVFGVHSTLGLVGKFTLQNTAGEEVASYGQLNFDPEGETQSLYLKQLLCEEEKLEEAIAQSFKVETLTNNGTVDFKSDGIWDFDKKTVRFDFKPLKSGTDTIRIYSPTFSFYLKINVATEVNDIKLYYRTGELSRTNEITTLSNDLELLVGVEPFVSSCEKTATLKQDGGSALDLDVKDDKIKIDSTKMTTTGKYELTVTAKHDTKIISKTWNINYTNDLTSLDIGLVEAEDYGKSQTSDGTIFLAAGQVQLTTTISIRTKEGNNVIGVSDSYYSKFSLTLDDHDISPTYNKFTTSATSPKQSLEYEKDVTLNFDKGGQSEILNIKKYHLSREIVSKIVLPNHDNTDQTDKKGLQKVHVYANQSYYNPTEKMVDYYKLPIELYNYNNEKLEGDEKAKAFEKLVKKVYIGNSLSPTPANYLKYNSQGFVEIHFEASKLYTFDEIYNNKFDDATGNKNFTVDICTHTQMADAHYTFVPVKGINIYCQEAFDPNGYAYDSMNVLQTDFAKEDCALSETNMPLTRLDMYNWGNIIGNGHTMNFDKQLLHEPKSTGARVYHLINATMQGLNSSSLTPETKYNINYSLAPRACNWSEHKDPFEIAYCDISYFGRGIYVSDEPSRKTYIKNCMFHDNINYGFTLQHKNTLAYVEDSVFFNAASFGIVNIEQAEIYLKGFIDVYNFHTGKEIFDNIQGVHVPFVWDWLCRPAAEKEHMIQINCDGKEVINSAVGSILGGYYHFYTGLDEKGQPKYEELSHGVPTAARYIYNFVNLDIPQVGQVGMWGTKHPDYEQGTPRYSDEYNDKGELQLDFYQHQLQKITRIPNYF